MNEFNNYNYNDEPNEPNFNFKRVKMILIAVTIIFFLLTISVFLFNQNKYKKIKVELLEPIDEITQREEEYKLKVISELQEINYQIPKIEQEIKEVEEKLRKARLKRRCLDYQLERITTNKGYGVDYCDSDKNLEQFKVETQTAKAEIEPQTVVF